MRAMTFGAGAGMVPGDSLSDKVSWLAKHRYGAIEVTGPDLVSKRSRAELIRSMQANPSVRVTSACHGFLVPVFNAETGFTENRGWLNDDEQYRKRGCENVLEIMKGADALVREAKKAGIELGPIRYVIPFDYAATSKCLPPHPQSEEERERYDRMMGHKMAQFEKSVAWLQSQFEKHGLEKVEVVIEPLNAYETGKINTLAEGWEFVSQFYAERPEAPRYFSVMGDLYHMGFEPERTDRAIAEHGDTSYFHVATQSDRRVPAPGFSDVGPALRAIRQVAEESGDPKVVMLEARKNGDDYVQRLENGARYLAKLAGVRLTEQAPAVGRPRARKPSLEKIELGPMDRADAIPIWSLGVAEPGRLALFGWQEDAELKEGEIRVATLHSGWSAGTEGALLSGNSARANEDFDKEAGLFRPKKESSGAAYPQPTTGYMEVGVVTDSKRKDVKPGEILCGTWGHKTGHTYRAEESTFVKLPPSIDPIVGILVAQMGPICANGLAHADRALRFPMTDAQIAVRQLKRLGRKQQPGSELKGRNAVVFGAGIVGLVTAMMAKAAGATVAIADVDEGRLKRAEKLGLIPIDVSDPSFDLGAYVKDELGWKTKSGKPGADVAFQCTAIPSALNTAMRCVGRQQPVIDLGYYTGGASDLYLGKEFHHLGLQHICAQVENLLSDWPKDELRKYTVRFLEEHGPAMKEHVISHDISFAEAGDFIATLRDRPDAFQVAMHP